MPRRWASCGVAMVVDIQGRRSRDIVDKAITALLNDLHIHARHPSAPISNPVAMELLVVLLLTLFFIAVRMRLSVENPGGLQHTIEGINGFVDGLAQEIIGHHSAKFVPPP